jgi:hypothetical protein
MRSRSVYYADESSNDVEAARRSERAVATSASVFAGTDSSLSAAAEDSHDAEKGTSSGTNTGKLPPLQSPSTGGMLGLTSFFSSIMQERINSKTSTSDEESDTEINFTKKAHVALFKSTSACSDLQAPSGARMSPSDVKEALEFTDLEAGDCKMPGTNDGLLESECDQLYRRSRKDSQQSFKRQNSSDMDEDSDDDDDDDLDAGHHHHSYYRYPDSGVDDDDDDSLSSSESFDGGGIIAIGMPVQKKATTPAVGTPPAVVEVEVAATPTKEESTQQVLSEVVAKNLAQEEHNLKTGEKTSPRKPFLGKRRSSTRMPPPVTAAGPWDPPPPPLSSPPALSSPSSHDKVLSSGSTSSSKRLVREPGSTAGTATASTMDMNERRAARAAARASRQSDKDEKKESPDRTYSSDESVVTRRIPMKRTSLSKSSFHSCSSGDSACTFATESMPPRSSRRTREESIKMKEQEQQDSGPCLAPATSFDRESSGLPGAFAFARQDRNAKEEDTGPSLASAVVPGMSGPVLAPATSGPMLSTPTPMSSSSAFFNENEEEEEELVAQAGIPVAYPGAFAIQGLDAGSGPSGYDSTTSVSSLGESRDQDLTTTESDHEEHEEIVEIFALEAELQLEHVVVDGAIIIIDPDEDELLSDPKVIRRLRMIQVFVLCFTVAAMAMVTASILGGFSTGNRPNVNVLTIEGWRQVGSELQGPTENAKVNFGTSVAISGDGEWIAITAPGVDDQSVTPNEVNVGQVRVLRAGQGSNGTEWFPSGIIKGPGPSREERTSLAMSSDGKRIAVGYYESEGGVVQLFERDEESDTFSGSITTEFVGDVDAWHGHSVDLSSDGTILAIGAPKTNTANGIRSGVVRIFRNIDSTWKQLGEDIEGRVDNEFFGWSVALRATDGLRVAVGSPDVINGGGGVRVYDWSSGEFWEEQAFPDIGDTSFGLLGDSVDLSSNGSILAVGSRGTFGLGRVQVFREVVGEGWIEDDATGLVGEQDTESFGDSVSLSSDGDILAIGAPQNSEFGAGSGMVKVLKFDVRSSTWIQQGTNIGGLSPDANFGLSVALSANGSRVVAGAPKALFNGALIEAGSARVYDRDETARQEVGQSTLVQNE